MAAVSSSWSPPSSSLAQLRSPPWTICSPYARPSAAGASSSASSSAWTPSSDPRTAHGATYQDLAAIAVDLLTANATSTKAKIGGLLDGKTADAATAQALRSCQVLYDGILQQPGSAAAVKGGKFSEAISSLEKSAAAAKECEDGFSKSHVASPVTVENSNAFQLAKLAVGLLYS
ncbi:hypothetical protein ZWY2020_026258 [Hordeum vulgare]|nr:hypothetical protein ZWY2020_026258 [Hordeum vulgare]